MEEVARALHIRSSTISKYESDKVKTIPQAKLDLLANFLYVKPSYRLGYDDDEQAAVGTLSISEQLMLEDFRELPVPYQRVVEQLIKSLKEANQNEKEIQQLTL